MQRLARQMARGADSMKLHFGKKHCGQICSLTSPANFCPKAQDVNFYIVINNLWF
jgi:hypothetical protein